MAHPATIHDFVTDDEVRAALGVSITELPAKVLNLGTYPIVIEMALDDVNTELRAAYDTVLALPSPTATQHRFLDATKMFALYALANHLLATLPMFSVKSLTDGRASFDRQVDAYKDTKEAVNAMYVSLRYRLEASFNVLYPASAKDSVTELLIKAVGLGNDPVTGT